MTNLVATQTLLYDENTSKKGEGLILLGKIGILFANYEKCLQAGEIVYKRGLYSDDQLGLF